jgi:tetratricopeptide (TPR) repeat protein
MRTFLWWLFVAAACTPFTLMALIAAEARYPALDHITLHNPSFMREFVGEVAITWVGYGKDSPPRLDRILRLAPENSEAWSRRCTHDNFSDPKAAPEKSLADCTRAVALESSEPNLNNLGLAQERNNKPCAAEDSFTSANSKVNAAYPFVLRNMGQAALACGHVPAAIAGFEVAESKDSQNVAVSTAKHEDPEDLEEEKEDLTQDRDWLILAYGRSHDPTQANQMCSTAHPTWKFCSCNVDDEGVKCTDSQHPNQP